MFVFAAIVQDVTKQNILQYAKNLGVDCFGTRKESGVCINAQEVDFDPSPFKDPNHCVISIRSNRMRDAGGRRKGAQKELKFYNEGISFEVIEIGLKTYDVLDALGKDCVSMSEVLTATETHSFFPDRKVTGILEIT
jgi:hypothetical protein